MRAIQLHEFGPAGNLVLDELAGPRGGTGQVRIAVAAAGVHLLDTTLRRGEPGPFPAPPLPTIPGREVAGVVDVRRAGRARCLARAPGRRPPRPGARWVRRAGGLRRRPRLRAGGPGRVRRRDRASAPGVRRSASSSSSRRPPPTSYSSRPPRVVSAGCWRRRRSRSARRSSSPRVAPSGPRSSPSSAPTWSSTTARTGWEQQVRASYDGVTLVYDGVGGDARADLARAAPSRAAGW